MIIAAIDNSGSTKTLSFYRDEVFRVLSDIQEPVRVILWSCKVESDHELSTIENTNQIFGDHNPQNSTWPEKFLEILPRDKPFQLYVFTDGKIDPSSIDNCYNIITHGKIPISYVYLYYIGDKMKNMGMQFTAVFRDFPQEIYIRRNRIAQVKAKPIDSSKSIDFSNVDIEYIMKDESFKVEILKYIDNPKIDKTLLKARVNDIMNKILKKHFEDELQLSIREFYENRDIEGCCKYVKNHSFYQEKSTFQRKMSDILKLFDTDIDRYSLIHFKKILPVTLDIPDTMVEKREEPTPLQEKDLEYLTCDILYDVCDVSCIPVKECSDSFWPDKKLIQNPFRLLESEECIQRIMCRIEPFVLDYKKTYQNLRNPDISPFSRDLLKGVYILHHPSLHIKSLMRHNNYILSTFFQNKLPGKPIIWHLVFLYVLGTRKFPEHKEIFFRNIRILSESETYFVSLIPYLNPPIVDTLNVCFWYVACVCPVVWANNKKNVLRKADFVSGVFLDFYRDVFDPSYEPPKQMSLWQLWYKFCSDLSKTLIFSVLSQYLQHDYLKSDNDKLISDKNFGIVLYRKKIEHPESLLDLETVLSVYQMYKRIKSPDFYANLSQLPSSNIRLFDKVDEGEDKLEHVRINIKTCQPYVRCSVSGRHWRDCIGKYDVMKQSYLKMFRRYCIEYKNYPKKANDLMIYLNKYIFKRNDRIPELFDSTLSRQMNQVIEIFKEIMETYTCKEYLAICNKMNSEKSRLECEELSDERVYKI